MLILKRIPIPEEKDNGNCISFRACEVGGEQESSKRAAEEQQAWRVTRLDGLPGVTGDQPWLVTRRDGWAGVTGDQERTRREPGWDQATLNQHPPAAQPHPHHPHTQHPPNNVQHPPHITHQETPRTPTHPRSRRRPCYWESLDREKVGVFCREASGPFRCHRRKNKRTRIRHTSKTKLNGGDIILSPPLMLWFPPRSRFVAQHAQNEHT